MGPGKLTPKVASKAKVFKFQIPAGHWDTVDGEENIDDEDDIPFMKIMKHKKNMSVQVEILKPWADSDKR